MRVRLLVCALLLAAAGVAQEPSPTLPEKGTPDDYALAKPQIAAATGKQAPDFSLADEEGKTVTLSSLRGSKVLLIFYRGYW